MSSSSNPLATIGAKIQKALHHNSHSSETGSVNPLIQDKREQGERSQSRGREAFQSSGRGGAGNIRLRSTSREPPADAQGPDDFSNERGRAIEPPSKTTHTGRGGAGNVRAPSADPAGERREAQRERSIVAAKTEEEKALPHSTGRGGFGNIDRSRSRSRNPDPVAQPHHSSGKGGYGNITATYVKEHDLAKLEEEERAAVVHPAATHSSGRGGAANVVSGPAPPIEALDKLKLSDGGATGRGGAGNVIEK